MIDKRVIADELHHVRLTRIETEAAYCELEELIWQMRHPPHRPLRVAYTFEGFGRKLANWIN